MTEFLLKMSLITVIFMTESDIRSVIHKLFLNFHSILTKVVYGYFDSAEGETY